MSSRAIMGPIPEISFRNVTSVIITEIVSNAGRRFKVGNLPGDKTVIFYALFKQAQALVQDAKTIDELHAIKEFINKLQDVETKSQAIYKKRNNWYKFRSFWHRFFGKAFCSTHLERLDHLYKKCEKKETRLPSKLHKENLADDQIAIDAFSNLTSQELEFARAQIVGRPWEFKWSGQNYIIWKERKPDGTLSIHVQNKTFEGTKENQIVVFLASEAYPSLIKVKGTVHEQSRELFNAGIHSTRSRPSPGANYTRGESFDRFQTYRELLMVNQNGPLMDPMLHIQCLGAILTGMDSSDFLVTNGPATDAGGVRRNYIATLIEALKNQKDLFLKVDGSLKLPRLKREENPIHFICSSEEKDVFQSLGKLFYLCYQAAQATKASQGNFDESSLATGRAFTDALFQAAFTLTQEEISQPFEDVRIEAKVRMASALISYLDAKTEDSGRDINRCLDLLNQENLLKSLAASEQKILFLAVTLVDEEKYFDMTFSSANEEAILADQVNFRRKLYMKLFYDAVLFKQLNGASLASVLEPIFQIALGMHLQGADWESIRHKKVTEVSEAIQGSMDRCLLVANIKYDGPSSVIQEKVGWLTYWIKEGATEEELKKFLKFVSGSTALPIDTHITIGQQSVYDPPLPTPSVCTCRIALSISPVKTYAIDSSMWDDTEEKFIRNLKFVIQGEEFTLR